MTHFPRVEREPGQPCSVVYDNTCKAPANGPYHVRATCYACGNAVCTAPACSRIVTWYKYGRRRVCRNCLEERRRGTEPLWLVYGLSDRGIEVFAPTAAEARFEAAQHWGLRSDQVDESWEVRPVNDPACAIAGQHNVRISSYTRGMTPIRPRRRLIGYKLRCRTPKCGWESTCNEDLREAERRARAHELNPTGGEG